MPRELSLLLAPEDEGPIPLYRNQGREILRRPERLEKLETDNARLEQDKEALRRELEEKRRELERLKKNLAALEVAPPPSKKLHRPAAPAEPGPKGGHQGGQPGNARHVRPRPDHVDETLDLTLDRCPDCGKRLGDPSDSYERFVTELVGPTCSPCGSSSTATGVVDVIGSSRRPPTKHSPDVSLAPASRARSCCSR